MKGLIFISALLLHNPKEVGDDKMIIQKVVIILALAILGACNTNTSPQTSKDQKEPETSNMSNPSTHDQSPSQEAKKTLQSYHETTKIYAVNTDKILLVALEVHQIDRIKLTTFEEKAAKKIKKQFPHLKTEVSTDQKLVFELNKLEKKVSKNEISNKKLEKEVKHLKELLHEKT
ncbi:hypothetical protein [Virgibacillus sp. DJP39]|uniref:hypothetical protein n=1 Tax=Virgibacillus sp. DJP39 TaxID=3409790 RepID=UPI003BB719C1